jgi:hypothetical protein
MGQGAGDQKMHEVGCRLLVIGHWLKYHPGVKRHKGRCERG